MAFRDNIAKLRGLAGEKGYRLEKAPIRDSWFLINEATGQLAVSDRGTTAFSVERAIKFLSTDRSGTKSGAQRWDGMQASTASQANKAAAPSRRIRRQYHVNHLALKHGLSRAEARRVLAAAGNSREKADEIALIRVAAKRTPHPVDEATHGSGNRNADHGVGSDEQKLPEGIGRRPALEEDAFQLPDKNGAGIKRPWNGVHARRFPFVFSTGYSGHGMREGYRDRPVLKKPFRYQDLTEILTRVLAT
jgi:hypothetical protein